MILKVSSVLAFDTQCRENNIAIFFFCKTVRRLKELVDCKQDWRSIFFSVLQMNCLKCFCCHIFALHFFSLFSGLITVFEIFIIRLLHWFVKKNSIAAETLNLQKEVKMYLHGKYMTNFAQLIIKMIQSFANK